MSVNHMHKSLVQFRFSLVQQKNQRFSLVRVRKKIPGLVISYNIQLLHQCSQIRFIFIIIQKFK